MENQESGGDNPLSISRESRENKYAITWPLRRGETIWGLYAPNPWGRFDYIRTEGKVQNGG